MVKATRGGTERERKGWSDAELEEGEHLGLQPDSGPPKQTGASFGFPLILLSFALYVPLCDL